MKKLTQILLTSFLAFICVVSVANAYTVKQGDTLWKIAQNAGISLTELINLNPQIDNPNLIYPGDQINTGALGIAVPEIAALFESSLQNSVASDATTMTLVSATLKNGNTLSGLYGFIIDEGNSNEEFVLCTASSTALTSCSRGIDPVDGKTEVASLKYSHRRGASIKITDYPILGIMRRILNGDETTPGGLTFGTNEITGLYRLNGTFDWLRYNTSTGALQWSNNGSDYYNFTSSSITQLTASSTAGIGVTDSKIYIKASTTLGGAFDALGNYYQKTSSTKGILTDSNGIYFDYTRNNTWTGTNTFSGTTTGILRIYGDGSDGDLSITSGTTTINLASSTVFEKNYNSISITGDGALAFTGAHSSGTLIILKSLNGVTISTTKKYAIDLTNTGAIGGLKDSGNGQNGTSLISNIYSSNLTAGAGGAAAVYANANAAGGVIGSKTGLYYPTTTNELSNIASFYLLRGLIGGSGGGGGTVFSGGGSGGSSGAGGASGGSLIILNGGQLNWTTSTINASGSAGASAITATDPVSGVKSGAGAGGGGAGGFVAIMSRNITNNYNSILVSGGAGGTGANASKISNEGNSAGGAGGAGGSNAFYLGGAGGRGGYESANPSTNGAAGQGVCGGAGGAKGTGDSGTYGVNANAGSGGGGGGGACGFGFSIEY